jgi:deazaflavin-dependent oxidoreductase (nitroreductase family)
MPAGAAKPYRKSYWRRALNALVRPLARLGLTGPRTHLLTVRGRKSGKSWSTPVSIVRNGDARWLVAPYGERNWVKNARAAGTVDLRRGRRRAAHALVEVSGDERVAVLRRYHATTPVTRSFFGVTAGDGDDAWRAEAPRHPVFRLLPP